MSDQWASPATDYSDIDDDDLEYSSLTIGEILFSFKGRIPRSTWWFANIGMTLGFYAIVIGLGLFVGAAGGTEELLMGMIFLLYVPLLWCSLAISAKRWHDRGKSGFFVLVAFIPIIGPFWQLVECGFLEGDPYRNEYGPRTT